MNRDKSNEADGMNLEVDSKDKVMSTVLSKSGCSKISVDILSGVVR